MTKKIVASAGILAAITALITGAATYASLSTRTESVINSFQGACVNIGVVEKNNTGDVLVLEDEGTDDNGVYGENNSNNINIYNKKTNNIDTLGIFINILNLVNIELNVLVKTIKILNTGLRNENVNDISAKG